MHASPVPAQPAQHRHNQLSIGTTSSALAHPPCAALQWSWWPISDPSNRCTDRSCTDPTPAPGKGNTAGPHPAHAERSRSHPRANEPHGSDTPHSTEAPGLQPSRARCSATVQPNSTAAAQSPGRATAMLREPHRAMHCPAQLSRALLGALGAQLAAARGSSTRQRAGESRGVSAGRARGSRERRVALTSP